MRIECALLLLALASLSGCAIDGKFRLAEVEQLTVGSSTRTQVERALGPPGGSLDRFSYCLAEASYVTPPAPFVFLSWPLFWSRTHESILLMARFDEHDVLAECSITLQSQFRTFLLIFFQPHGHGFEVDAEREATLRRIQAQGIAVRIFGGTPEEPYLPLDAYLEQRR